MSEGVGIEIEDRVLWLCLGTIWRFLGSNVLLFFLHCSVFRRNQSPCAGFVIRSCKVDPCKFSVLSASWERLGYEQIDSNWDMSVGD